jgi:hypothetical protein
LYRSEYKIYFILGFLSEKFAKHSPREPLEHVPKEICMRVPCSVDQTLGRRLTDFHNLPNYGIVSPMVAFTWDRNILKLCAHPEWSIYISPLQTLSQSSNPVPSKFLVIQPNHTHSPYICTSYENGYSDIKAMFTMRTSLGHWTSGLQMSATVITQQHNSSWFQHFKVFLPSHNKFLMNTYMWVEEQVAA